MQWFAVDLFSNNSRLIDFLMLITSPFDHSNAIPQWVYTVVFDGGEIWGEGADPTLTVSIDAWESYLERV